MTTIKELKAELAALTAKVNSLEANQALPDILRKPEKNEGYWYINALGEAYYEFWTDVSADYELWVMGNVYPTKEDAEYALAKRKAHVKFERIAAQAWVDAGEVIDWGDESQQKWDVCYIHYLEKFKFTWIVTQQSLGGVYFPSETSAQAAVEAMGDVMEYLK